MLPPSLEQSSHSVVGVWALPGPAKPFCCQPCPTEPVLCRPCPTQCVPGRSPQSYGSPQWFPRAALPPTDATMSSCLLFVKWVLVPLLSPLPACVTTCSNLNPAPFEYRTSRLTPPWTLTPMYTIPPSTPLQFSIPRRGATAFCVLSFCSLVPHLTAATYFKRRASI